MYLYFERANGEYVYIKSDVTKESAFVEIHNWLKENAPHFKSYYTRRWISDNGDFVFDVGSHNEFFILSEVRKDGSV